MKHNICLILMKPFKVATIKIFSCQLIYFDVLHKTSKDCNQTEETHAHSLQMNTHGFNALAIVIGKSRAVSITGVWLEQLHVHI